jgi:hypothetical protein
MASLIFKMAANRSNRENGRIAQRYPHTKFHWNSPSGYETCLVNGRRRRTPCHSYTEGELKSLRLVPPLTEVAHAFLKCKFKELGEYVPHKDVIYLPGNTKKSVYTMYERAV